MELCTIIPDFYRLPLLSTGAVNRIMPVKLGRINIGIFKVGGLKSCNSALHML